MSKPVVHFQELGADRWGGRVHNTIRVINRRHGRAIVIIANVVMAAAIVTIANVVMAAVVELQPGVGVGVDPYGKRPIQNVQNRSLMWRV